MNLQLNKEYRFINHPRTFVKILEIKQLDNDEVYLRYIITDTNLNESYEDSRTIRKDMINQTFENYSFAPGIGLKLKFK